MLSAEWLSLIMPYRGKCLSDLLMEIVFFGCQERKIAEAGEMEAAIAESGADEGSENDYFQRHVS